jgi:DNA-binding SARP family transcriptional activator
LVADLWPESGSAEARHLLRESLYLLRSALGEDSVLSTGDDLRLNPKRVTCDLWEFEAALARDDLEAAVGVYRGSFFSGFHLSGAEEFERWADGERSRLARRYGQALEQLGERAMAAGDSMRAVEWWARLAGEDPYNSRITLRYMQALEAAGDRAGALRHAKAHAELLRTDLGAAPEGEVVALAERLRQETRPVMNDSPAAVHATSVASIPHDDEGGKPKQTLPSSDRRPRTYRAWAVSTVLVLAVIVGLGVLGGRLSRARSPVLVPRRVAAAAFENRTGRPDLDDLGALAADWIIGGVMETPLADEPEVEAVYARGRGHIEGRSDALTLAQQDGAAMVIRGSYYLSGDSVLFQAGIMDVASGRLLRSFDPVGARVERASDALRTLRERIAGGLGPLVSPFYLEASADPELIPPSLPAYREFVAGLKLRGLDDWPAQAEHYRRAARLDSTFVAPLIELAFGAIGNDGCAITDSVGIVLDQRHNQLTAWNHLTIAVLRARCRGDRAAEIRLLGQRYRSYPLSPLARGTYATLALQNSNQPRAARETLRGIVPDREPEWLAWYWSWMAATWHMPGEYGAELGITDHWRDSTSPGWQIVRGRALAALGREREVMELLGSTAGSSVDSFARSHLVIATELAVHGYPGTAMTVAESILARFELSPASNSDRAANAAWANRLLGRNEAELEALEQIAHSDADTLAKLEAEARIAVLLADTAKAGRIDTILRDRSSRPLRAPWTRGGEIIARAHIAAGFGRRKQAVTLLRDAAARGNLRYGSSHVFHGDLLLVPLRGYPPFDALLKPDK